MRRQGDLRLIVSAAFIVVFGFGAQVCFAAPSVYVPPAQNATVGTPLAIVGTNISNASDNLLVSINASSDKGTFSLKQTSGLTFFGGDGVADPMMTFKGTLVNINAAIDTITYTATSAGVENLVVKAVDQGAATDKTIVINITSTSNHAPVFINEPYAFSISKNSANGTVVGTVSATDQDAGDTLTYSITFTSGSTDDVFALNPSSGQITVNNSAGLAQTSPITISVQVKDNGNLTDTTTVTINLTTVNNPGDVFVDGVVNLKDVIRAGQVSCGMVVSITTSGDVNGDGKIGIPEMIFGMEVVAGRRTLP